MQFEKDSAEKFRGDENFLVHLMIGGLNLGCFFYINLS
jgi:hypothetical protein